MKLFIALLFFSLTSTAVSFAKTQDFTVEKDHFKVEVPDTWIVPKYSLGAPVALVSKMGKSDRRSVVQIVPYGIKDDENKLKKFEKDPEDYVEQKENWLESVRAESLSYDDYAEEKINGNTLYSIGVTYHGLDGVFHERQYYISTASHKIFYVKTLIPDDLEKTDNQVSEKIVRSIASI